MTNQFLLLGLWRDTDPLTQNYLGGGEMVEQLFIFPYTGHRIICFI